MFVRFCSSLDPQKVFDFVFSDELAEFGENLRAGPSPVLDVAVSEREITPLRMSAGWEVTPLSQILTVLPVPRWDAEMGIEDAIFMDIDEKEKFRRYWIVDVGFFCKAGLVNCFVGKRQAID